MVCKIKLSTALFCISLTLGTNVHAQRKTDDCLIYEKVLTYLDGKEAHNKEIYEGTIDPESGEIGKKVERSGCHKYNFYIVNKIYTDFDYLSVRDWFSKLLKDSTVIQRQYVSTSNKIINCAFSDSVKYQYKSIAKISFSKKDFFNKKCRETMISYRPIRVTFSKVLYTENNKALLFITTYQGMGRGIDQWAQGFIFEKKNNEWALSLTEGEVR
jgi:hypothetical protein